MSDLPNNARKPQFNGSWENFSQRFGNSGWEWVVISPVNMQSTRILIQKRLFYLHPITVQFIPSRFMKLYKMKQNMGSLSRCQCFLCWFETISKVARVTRQYLWWKHSHFHNWDNYLNVSTVQYAVLLFTDFGWRNDDFSSYVLWRFKWHIWRYVIITFCYNKIPYW